jgi:hypothetical protein
MNWLILLAIWISIDIVVIATYWYAATVIKVHFPNWWKQVICDDAPMAEPELDEVASSFPMTTTHPDTRT